MTGFLLKNLISAFLLPIASLSFILLCSWLVRRRLPKLANIGFWAALSCLVMLSSNVGSQWLSAPLESLHPTLDLAAVEQPISYIMVLGSGHDDEVSSIATQQLSSTALARLLEGIRCHRHWPQSTLVFSGWKSTNQISHAKVMKQAAMALGVPEAKIITLPESKDTGEEAKDLRLALSESEKSGTGVLVTSATHMRRSMGIFEKQGLLVKAAPTDFRARRGYWWRLNADSLVTSQRALHEYIGTLWYWLKGDL